MDYAAEQRATSPLVTLAVWATFVLLMLTAGAVLWMFREARLADGRVSRTIEVKDGANFALGLIKDAETGQRGYLLTGAPAYLDPYLQSVLEVDQAMERLRRLTADSAEQQQRLTALQSLVDARLDLLEQGVVLVQQQRMSEAIALLRSGRGKELMDEIRQVFTEILATENHLLSGRRDRAAATWTWFTAAMVTALLITALLALFALTMIRRYIDALRRHRIKLQGLNTDLEQRVRERTAELEKSTQVAEQERVRAETLLTDLNHRVGNNLALVSSFLSMQQRMTRHPEAQRALESARARVQSIAAAHRKLRLGDDFSTVRASGVLAAVLEDIRAGLPEDGIVIEHRLDELDIRSRDAVSLGVLVSELVLNAIRHGFSAGDRGTVMAVLSVDTDQVPYLEVSDDGVGWEEVPSSSGGLGSRIIDMIAHQFEGRVERSIAYPGRARPGTRTRINLAKLRLTYVTEGVAL